MSPKHSNTTLSSLICNILSDYGIKDICISPGSRNTPLTVEFLSNEKFRCYSQIDERSCAFFALGISKASLVPSVILTTSGTAAANLLPAIIEADLSLTPLIVITADRPSHLINTGENQTINQINIFDNYVRENISIESGLDSIENFWQRINQSILLSLGKHSKKPSGPIHINIAFDEPLMDKKRIIGNLDFQDNKIKSKNLVYTIPKCSKPIIICGAMDSDRYLNDILILSESLNAPIFADPLSQMRFNKKHPNIISHYNYLLTLIKEDPDCIIRFGRKSTTSKILNNLIKNSTNVILFSDKYGYNDDCAIIKPLDFKLIKYADNLDTKWLHTIVGLENDINKILSEYLISNNLFEGNIISSVVNSLDDNNNLFIGNSLPIRNLERFCSNIDKKISVYSNRGASGIDGITSTALGIASMHKNSKNVLVIGDLSFIHDINGLLITQSNNINLTIVVINNNGGQIFSTLPYAKENKRFKDYWITPQNIEIEYIAQLYDIKYFKINSIHQLNDEFKHILNFATEQSNVKIIEVKCDISNTQKVEEEIDQRIKDLH